MKQPTTQLGFPYFGIINNNINAILSQLVCFFLNLTPVYVLQNTYETVQVSSLALVVEGNIGLGEIVNHIIHHVLVDACSWKHLCWYFIDRRELFLFNFYSFVVLWLFVLILLFLLFLLLLLWLLLFIFFLLLFWIVVFDGLGNVEELIKLLLAID